MDDPTQLTSDLTTQRQSPTIRSDRISMSRVDLLTAQALKSGTIRVELPAGDVFTKSGLRAEQLDKRSGYGRVIVFRRPMTLAMAHRVVWIAAYGPIPQGLQINHINRRRWDNRIENLELVTPAGNARHWQGHPYDAISEVGNVDLGWLSSYDAGIQNRHMSPYRDSPEELVVDEAA